MRLEIERQQREKIEEKKRRKAAKEALKKANELKKLKEEMEANLPEFCEHPHDWEHLARCFEIVEDGKNPIDFIEEDSVIEDYFFNPPEV